MRIPTTRESFAEHLKGRALQERPKRAGAHTRLPALQCSDKRPTSRYIVARPPSPPSPGPDPAVFSPRFSLSPHEVRRTRRGTPCHALQRTTEGRKLGLGTSTRKASGRRPLDKLRSWHAPCFSHSTNLNSPRTRFSNVNCGSHPDFDSHHEVHRFEDQVTIKWWANGSKTPTGRHCAPEGCLEARNAPVVIQRTQGSHSFGRSRGVRPGVHLFAVSLRRS